MKGKAAPVLQTSDNMFFSHEKSQWWPLNNRKLCVVPVDTVLVTNCLA